MSEICVSQLSVYPVKSTTGIHLNHAFVEDKGLAFDRRFVVARHDGRFISARSHPRLLQVHSALLNDGLHLRAPRMPALDLRYSEFESNYADLTLWGDVMQGQCCGQHADRWFSRYLDEPVQLLYFGSGTRRDRAPYEALKAGQVSFADGSPLLLTSQASLGDLNQRLTKPVRMEQFRPNLVLKGCQAYAEDGWQRIRIGEVVFDVTTACSRCVMTTVKPDGIDPISGEVFPDPDNQPLATLARYRQGDDGQAYFGQNLVALNRGKISLYDEVEVLQTRPAAVYPDHAPRLPTPPLKDSAWQQDQLASLQCVAVTDETRDVKTFIFRRQHADDVRTSDQPGQFVCLELEIDGEPVHRNYTLSSSPSRPERLAITVKRVEGGLVSNWLNDHLKPGDVIRATAPDGDFHCFAAPQD